MTHDEVPNWPEIKAAIDHTGNGEVLLNGVSYPITAPNADAGRDAVREFVLNEAARKLNRPVRLHTSDDTGEWDLIVHPDGSIDDVTPAAKQRRARRVPEPQAPAPEPHPVAVGEVPAPSPTPAVGPMVWGAQLTPPPPPPPAPAPIAAEPVVERPQPPVVQPVPESVAAPELAPVVDVAPTPPPAPAPAPVVQPIAAQLVDELAPEPVEEPAPAQTRRVGGGSFVRQPPPVPQMGARALLYKASAGLINLGPAETEQYLGQLLARIRTHLTGTHNITVMCLKGGIGKTTTSLGLGLTLAKYRADQVLGLDMNPDAGDLADRALGHDQVEAISPRTITDVLRAIRADTIHDLTELNRYTQVAERLHLIAGEQAPDVSESITTEDYLAVRDVVDRFYPLTITDCGTGVTHPAMRGILDRTDQVIVASGWAVSGAKRAQRTLEWLHNQEQYRDLSRNAVVVLTENARVPRDINRQEIVDTLGQLCKAVHLIPFDPSLSRGDIVHTKELARPTRQAYIELAATVVDSLAN